MVNTGRLSGDTSQSNLHLTFLLDYLILHCNWIYFIDNFTYNNLLFFTGHSQDFMVANAKHQQQTMDINYGLFSSLRNISDKDCEEYDLKKHQSQHIWKGNRLRLIVGKNTPRNTHVFVTTAKQAEWSTSRLLFLILYLISASVVYSLGIRRKQYFGILREQYFAESNISLSLLLHTSFAFHCPFFLFAGNLLGFISVENWFGENL